MTDRLDRDELARIVGNSPRAIRVFERLIEAVRANITGPSAITLNYSNDGTLVDPLPVIVQFQLVPENGVAYRRGVSWGVTVLAGTFSGSGPTIGGTGTGFLQLNSGIATNTVTLGITARINGRGYPPLTVTVSKVLAGSGGGTGASDSVTSFTALSTAAFAPVTRDLSITLPTGVTTATLTAASLSLVPANALPVGETTVEMKWQRESAPSVWSDVGAVATSSPNPNVSETFDPPLFFGTQGAITCNRSATGLVAGSAQKFRLVARASAGNVRTITVVGTASAAS